MDSAITKTDSLTAAQREAVVARGNVLVMAGAGTGKTKTLVERCLDCLEREGAMIDEILVVTFTEAAAAEMRERLRRALESRAQSESLNSQSSTLNVWTEQLARFDLAHIGTLHSFCLKLVREHFYELSLDPRLAILDEGETRQLASELLDDQFTAHYGGSGDFSLAVQNLIQTHGGGRDEQIRKLVLQLHHYSQARPDAAGWLARQRDKFSGTEPADWARWLREAVENWRGEWLIFLETEKAGNEKAVELIGVLSRMAGLANNAGWRKAAAEMLTQIVSADDNWPARRKTVLRKPIEAIFEEAGFLQSLVNVNDGKDPLVEDWSWVRSQMETLLRLAEEFGAKLAGHKQDNGVLDFHDLEQFSLKLLWSFSTGKPTTVAESWRVKLRFVFVDEYQDINAAQDKIIQGLSRDGTGANRFLVGDVKQSIYRFRLADPKIFRDYARTWRGNIGRTIPLLENFRSREGLLSLINSIFRRIMCEEVGGVAYDEDAELKFGSPQTRASFGLARDPTPCAEMLVRFKNGRGEIFLDDEGELAGLADIQCEARVVAHRLQQLVAAGHEIFDRAEEIFRPVKWRDMAILLRSPRGRSEIFAKEFERAGVPLAVARGGFYQSAEILDLISLLQLLDNPLQDVPCIAVLRSPFVGLSLNELAEIRLVTREGHFWTALNRSRELGTLNAGTREKVSAFLDCFSCWRKAAKTISLSQCLEEVLVETLYVDWLRTRPRGVQRAANVTGFMLLAQEFDQFQRQGLFRFLKFIEAQQEAEVEPEVPATATEDAVRLMSIHQSKGLEFPVVVLADLSKQFNEQDLRGEIIFDEEFGLCPKIKPPHVGRRYPSLPHWLAQRRQRRELRGEELRLFYVALTRARDHLILTASVAEKKWGEKWMQPQPVTARKIVAAKCFADWLALWFSNQTRPEGSQMQGECEHLRWQVVSDSELGMDSNEKERNRPSTNLWRSTEATDSELDSLRSRLEWEYPFKTATQRRAKSSVTTLRREAEELDDEAEQLFSGIQAEPAVRRASKRKSNLSASEIGAAHHKFLQHVALDKVDDLSAESERLVQESYLREDEHSVLDFAALAEFWNSALGHKIREHRDEVRRELPFTARFSPLELAKIIGNQVEPQLEEEFVIVQGVADLVVLRPDEIWLVDFKTDEISKGELTEKTKLYKPQLLLYASALEKIFERKVTLRALHFLALSRTVEI